MPSPSETPEVGSPEVESPENQTPERESPESRSPEGGPGRNDAGPSPGDPLRPANPDRLAETDQAGPELDRLPPPIFPPGSRRTAARYYAGSGVRKGGAGVPDDAFISPDDPIRKTDGWDGAFISPDEPIVRSEAPEAPADEEEEVVVTGIGTEGSVYSVSEGSMDPATLDRLAGRLETVARDLREEGVEALHVGPGTDRLDAILRSFLSGYLRGREE